MILQLGLDSGAEPTAAQALAMSDFDDLPALMRAAAAIRDRGHGSVISYSKKVFIPLTKLCRDFCHYCTFAQPPRRGYAAYLSPDQVLAIARAGARAGCREALFTLGDKPELRYQRGARVRLRSSDIRRRSTIWLRWRHWFSKRPGCCRTSIPA